MILFDGFEILTFRFARTMPNLPHEYTRRVLGDMVANAAYVGLFERIREQGVREFAPERPGKKRYRNTYWYPGDGYKYWAMTTRITDSLIINRTLVQIHDANGSPQPEFVVAAERAAAAIAKWPAEERRRVGLVQALALGAQNDDGPPGG